MSCNNDNYNNICRQDIPYPQVSPESVPSLIDNLVNALYGSISKCVKNGRVIWNIPCDPNNTSEVDNIPREEGEGLLCYLIRVFNNTLDINAPFMRWGFDGDGSSSFILSAASVLDRNENLAYVDGVVQDHHLLSNAQNGYRYDVVATGADTMANIVAILFGTEGLMVGRSIAPTGKIWWNDDNKVYYIDAWLAEGTIPDRWEQLGIVRIVADGSASDDVTVRQRANRKVIPVTTTTLPTT